MSETVNWDRLLELREYFLGNARGERDYWLVDGTLDSYDATFAQRIGWKWDFVMAEVLRARWALPDGVAVCDWGCGTGIAGRSFLTALAGTTGSHLPVRDFYLHDRSMAAMQYSRSRLEKAGRDLTVHSGLPPQKAFFLISHVATELSPEQFQSLIHVLEARAEGFIWVEPGAYGPSRALLQVHRHFLGQLFPWAPCPGMFSCPMQAADRWDDWCHQFAHPPVEVFQDPFWAAFAEIMGVDLRSLPVSFLCMDRRKPALNDPSLCRFLGRPHRLKYQMEVTACHQGAIKDIVIPKRSFPDQYKAFKKGHFSSMMSLEESGSILQSCEELPD